MANRGAILAAAGAFVLATAMPLSQSSNSVIGTPRAAMRQPSSLADRLNGAPASPSLLSQGVIPAAKSQDLEIGIAAEYNSLLEKILRDHAKFQANYFKAASETEKKEVIGDAREYLIRTLTQSIFPAWYGTPWSFNGHTEVPKKDSIACGYFITTTLEHLGFKLNRYSMARQPSENIIKNLVSNPDVLTRFSNEPIESFVKKIKEMGEGVYLVGLDIHVGFVVNINGSVIFTHSSYYPPRRVLSEGPFTVNPLRDSNYRVAGTLFDDGMVKKWLTGEKFRLEYDFFKGKK